MEHLRLLVLHQREVRLLIEHLRIEPGKGAHLAKRDPRDTYGLDKEKGEKRLAELHERLDALHRRLFAENRRSVLVVLQGLDGSGKDGVIRRAFTGLNPQGCRVVGFRAPSSTELAHDYLWRVHLALPARGEIGIFNRSHYEDVVAVRMLELAPEEIWRRRPGHIAAWERMLVDEGTAIVKIFLHVSKDEQGRRFQERVDDPEKEWKFRKDDLKVHDQYEQYLAAWDDVIEETSTEWAAWHVVPADRNWFKALAAAELLARTLEELDPQLPDPEPGIEGLKIA